MQGNESETIKSAKGMVQTPDTRVIVPGGPSSSEILNELRDALITDTVELDRRVTDLQELIDMANTIFGVGITNMASRVNAVDARIPTASGKFLADFFTSDFVHSSNTATINTVYGQATLPILSTQEKLVGGDTTNGFWVPKTTQLMYSYTGAAPGETDWLTDDKAVRAVDHKDNTAWWRNRPTSGTVWVRVKLPANLNANKNSNTIILHPFPPLKFDLVSVEYRNPAGVFSSADLTYLEGWSTTKNLVEWFGNVRIFIPQSQVTDFSPYSLGSLDEITLFGKDQDALSYLTTSANGALASVALTQNTQNTTPVISGIEVEVEA
jgi:hypothetical protein